MGRQSPYPEEFRKDAVALYRVSGGKRTYAAVAADLGITGETLRTWVFYRLTGLGLSLEAALAGLRTWAEEHMAEIDRANEANGQEADGG